MAAMDNGCTMLYPSREDDDLRLKMVIFHRYELPIGISLPEPVPGSEAGGSWCPRKSLARLAGWAVCPPGPKAMGMQPMGP